VARVGKYWLPTASRRSITAFNNKGLVPVMRFFMCYLKKNKGSVEEND